MKLSFTIIDQSTAFASDMAAAIKAQHASTPFADADEVSEWMYRTFSNPRIGIRTNEAGNRIDVTSRKLVQGKEIKYLTIDCQ